MLRQQQELAQLVADFEATRAQSEAALARLARGDPGGHLARLQVCVSTSNLCYTRYLTNNNNKCLKVVSTCQSGRECKVRLREHTLHMVFKAYYMQLQA